MENFRNLSDAQLVSLCANGHESCMNELIRRYGKQLKSYICKLVKRVDVCDDIFQDVCIKAYEKLRVGKYSSAEGKFVSWIIRIAHNVIIDMYRSWTYKSICREEEHESGVAKYWSGQEYYDAEIVAQEYENQIDKMWRLVSELPEVQRTVMVLRYEKDMSFSDIASVMNVSINTALGRERYARLNLRKMWNNCA